MNDWTFLNVCKLLYGIDDSDTRVHNYQVHNPAHVTFQRADDFYDIKHVTDWMSSFPDPLVSNSLLIYGYRLPDDTHWFNAYFLIENVQYHIEATIRMDSYEVEIEEFAAVKQGPPGEAVFTYMHPKPSPSWRAVQKQLIEYMTNLPQFRLLFSTGVLTIP